MFLLRTGTLFDVVILAAAATSGDTLLRTHFCNMTIPLTSQGQNISNPSKTNEREPDKTSGGKGQVWKNNNLEKTIEKDHFTTLSYMCEHVSYN